jgi:hypothetical protein
MSSRALRPHGWSVGARAGKVQLNWRPLQREGESEDPQRRPARVGATALTEMQLAQMERRPGVRRGIRGGYGTPS